MNGKNNKQKPAIGSDDAKRKATDGAMIEIKNLTYKYGEKEIFTDVNLSFEKGQLYCLVGPNGCGKSTLVDCLLNVGHPASGQVLVDGVDVAKIKAAQLARKIAYVPQIHDKTFPYTVFQIVLMGRTAYNGMSGPGAKDREIVLRALSDTGILELKDRPYTQISGGEMQLVMLARALVQDTPAIIMDEPTAHLDFRNEMIFLEAVARLIQKRNVLCILVTHSPDHPFYFEEKLGTAQVVAFRNHHVKTLGAPSEIMDEAFIRDIFNVEAAVITCERDGRQLRRILPIRSL